MSRFSKQPRYDKDIVKQAANGRWIEILESVCGMDSSILDGRHHPCPRCGGKDRFRALDINSGALICNQCFNQKNGDGFAAIMWLRDCDFSTAVKLAGEYLHVGNGKPSQASDPSRPPPAKPKQPVVDYELYDRAYNLLIDKLELSPKHHDDLRRRGLSGDDIQAGRYRTLPSDTMQIAQDIYGELRHRTYKVPGLQAMKIRSQPGLLVPVRSAQGKIIAIKYRMDGDCGDGKYRYLTTKTRQFPNGPSPGAPAHVPAKLNGSCQILRCTEGELKADVASALSTVPTISFPGANQWKVVVPVIEALQATTIRLAFDADWPTNESVAKELVACYRELCERGFKVEVETWPIAHGKGIDDVLAAGHKPTVLAGDQAKAKIDEIEQSIPKQSAKSNCNASSNLSPNGKPNKPRLVVDAWLADSGIEVRQSAQPSEGSITWHVLNACQEGHGHDGESCFTQECNGRMSFRCEHQDCRTTGWHQIKRKLGPPKPHHYVPPLNSNGSVNKDKSTTINEPIPAKPQTLEPNTIVRAGDRGNIGTVLCDKGETCLVHFISPEGVEAEKEISKSLLKRQDGTQLDEDAAEPIHIELIPSCNFAAKDYHQCYLVRNILVSEQPAIVGGRSKTMKTSLMIDLALSLGTGTPFLGEFHADQCSVAILSGESGEFTVQETARRVSKSKGIELSEADVHWGFTLPQLGREGDLRVLGDSILAHSIDVIMIDPAYLCLLAGNVKGLQSSNVFDMGPLLLKLSELGQQTNCSVLLCHHCRKNSPAERFDPPDLEELSMAGFAEWARQWLLLGRREPYEQGSGDHHLWLNVGGSAGHSGCYGVNVNEGQLQDDFTGRIWDTSVTSVTDARKESMRKKERENAKRQEEREEEYKTRILDILKELPNGETKSAIRDAAGLNNQNFSKGIQFLLGEGRVEMVKIAKNGKEYDAYKWTGK